MTESLFAECVFPGCTNPADAHGHPCPTCLRECGDYLVRRPDGTPMTADQQPERDNRARDADADQWAILSPALTARADRALNIEAGHQVKPGQTCWICEERRSCHRINGRWECRQCQQIQ